MQAVDSFLSEVFGVLNLDFACCSSEVEAVRREERAILKARSPFEEDDAVRIADFSQLPTILGLPPSAEKSRSGPTADTPTSASSRANGFSLGLPMGQHIHSDALTSNSGWSELSEVVDDYGAKYKGQWLGEQRHGRGVLLHRDGERYEGQFRNGLAHGRGFFVDLDGSLYEGQWAENRQHGFGMYTFADGTTYEGQWLDGKKHGTGSELWADGAKFEGQFAEGFKNGAGVYLDSQGHEYTGQFRNDKMDGIGTYIFEGGRRYSGYWHEGRMHGHGRMEWVSGMTYDGNYEAGLRNGEGTMSSPDGSSYTGEWAAGKQHGTGVSNDGHGSRWQETWDRGTRVSSVQFEFGDAAPSARSSGSAAAVKASVPILDLASLSSGTEEEGDPSARDAGEGPPIATDGPLPVWESA